MNAGAGAAEDEGAEGREEEADGGRDADDEAIVGADASRGLGKLTTPSPAAVGTAAAAVVPAATLAASFSVFVRFSISLFISCRFRFASYSCTDGYAGSSALVHALGSLSKNGCERAALAEMRDLLFRASMRCRRSTPSRSKLKSNVA